MAKVANFWGAAEQTLRAMNYEPPVFGHTRH
jgi:hypothetical protein